MNISTIIDNFFRFIKMYPERFLPLLIFGLVALLVKNINSITEKPASLIKSWLPTTGLVTASYMFYTSFYNNIAVTISVCSIIMPITYYTVRNKGKRVSIKKKQIVLTLSNLKWDLKEFCRGWLITGETGSGKTSGAIQTMYRQLFKNVPNWGGLIVDAKGSCYRDIEKVATEFNNTDKLITLKTGLNIKHRFNLLSYKKMPWHTYAQLIVNVASSMGQAKGMGSTENFFKQQATIAIRYAMELLDKKYSIERNNRQVTLKAVKNILSERGINRLFESLPCQLMEDESVRYFTEDFLGQAKKAPQQFQGVVSTISNYLSPYTDDEVVEVFCSEKATFSFDDIDNGKIICVAVSNVYSQRNYINTFMKLLYYYHAQLREDFSYEEKENKNLLIFFADEAQAVVTSAEGMDDSTVVDKIRSTNSTVVFSTQSTTSFLNKLDVYKTETLLLNLCNKIYFRQADERAAKLAESDLGKSEEFQKQSYGFSHNRGNVTYQKKETGKYKYFNLRKLADFECIIKHCKGMVVKTFLKQRCNKF